MIQRFFLIILLAIKSVSAEEILPNGKQTLAKMAQSMHTLNYQGTVAFLRNGKLEPMKYFHASQNGLEQERLLSLNSPLREIIRDSEKVSCLFKSTRQIVVDYRPFERSFLLDLPNNLDELDALYHINVIGEEDIAMLPAYVIEIQSKDNLRYARKIWVEKQQFLPLKVVVYDLSNQILEQLVFTDLEIKDKLSFVDVKHADAVYRVETINKLQEQSSDQAAFTLSSVPPGFREIFFTRRPMHNSEQPVDHLLLGDGLASVSIYLEHKNANLPPNQDTSETVQSIGAINFFSQTLGDFELTVMGEVPEQTVKLIAESIKLREQTIEK